MWGSMHDTWLLWPLIKNLFGLDIFRLPALVQRTRSDAHIYDQIVEDVKHTKAHDQFPLSL